MVHVLFKFVADYSIADTGPSFCSIRPMPLLISMIFRLFDLKVTRSTHVCMITVYCSVPFNLHKKYHFRIIEFLNSPVVLRCLSPQQPLLVELHFHSVVHFVVAK